MILNEYFQGLKYAYKFKRGPYKVFMCCFTNEGAECEFRVILHDNKVYPIEGHHSHHVENEASTSIETDDETKMFTIFKEDIKQRLQNALLKRNLNK